MLALGVLLTLAGPLSAGAVSVHLRKGAPSGDYWVGKNGDLLRTGTSKYFAPSQLEQGPTWSFTEEGDGLVRAAPIIDSEKNIYLATIRGRILKMSYDGKSIWNYTTGSAGEIPGVPALMDGTLFTATGKGFVIALDAATGKERWRTKAGQSSSGDTWSMMAADGVVVAGIMTKLALSNNRITALDAQTGAIKWNYDPVDLVYNFLSSVKDHTLVFSDSAGRAYRLNLSDGKVLWQTQVPARAGKSTGGAVIGPNGIVYVTSNMLTSSNPLAKILDMGATLTKFQKGLVTAYRLEDGKQLWQTPIDLQANNGAAVGPISADGKLSVVIGVGTNPSPPSLPAAANLIISREKPGKVYALDAETGKVRWSFAMPKWQGAAAGDTLSHVCLPDSFSNPVIGGDGTVYAGFESGHLWALRDKDGNGVIDGADASSYDFHNAFQGSPGLAPGMLVATPCNGMHVFLSKTE